MKHLCWGILLLPFFLNCATHAPMSEMVMFSPKIIKPKEIPGDSVQLYYSGLGMGLSIDKNFINPSYLRDYTGKNYDNREIDVLSYFPAIGINTVFMFKNNDTFAVNLTNGITSVGGDLTIRVYKTLYLTYGYSVNVGNQLVFQRRMSHKYNSGVSLGFFYDEFSQVLHEECSKVCLGPSSDQFVDLKAIGIRGLWLDTSSKKNKMFAKHTAKIGYILDYGSPYVALGITFGIY